jgi:signal peptidase I
VSQSAISVPRSRRSRKWLRPALETAVLLFLLLLVVRGTLQNFHIRGHSMEPTLHDQEYMVVNRAAYLLQSPARGDIVVFRYPNDPSEDYVKRVIAVPGDVVSVIGELVMVDGVPLQEVYVSAVNATNPYRPIVNLTVGANEYFVIGDNRGNSSDSRQWGFVPRANLIGKAVLVYWPFGVDNFGLLPDMSQVFAKVSDQ